MEKLIHNSSIQMNYTFPTNPVFPWLEEIEPQVRFTNNVMLKCLLYKAKNQLSGIRIWSRFDIDAMWPFKNVFIEIQLT